MIPPDRREITWMILALVWFFVIGPPFILLSISLGLPPVARVWIGWFYMLIYGLLLGVGVFLYVRRVAREMGAPGLVVTVIWILLAILMAQMLISALISAFRSAGP